MQKNSFEIQTAPLFDILRNSDKKIVIAQGGGDSAKTVSILQIIAHDLCFNKNVRVATVTGQDLPNLKRGALRSFQKYVEPDIRFFIKAYNIAETTYTFTNGAILEFKSFKDELDARGSERDILFMNECNGQSYQLFWQAQRKTRWKVYLDYNPTAPFWVHEKLINGGEKQFVGKWQRFISDHRHNPFLTEDEHQSYEDISDPDMFKVYSRGQTGKVSGLVLAHFKRIDVMPECERYVFGIDYGYTNDPTAIVKMGILGRKRYFQEMCYKPGLSAQTIFDLLMIYGYKPTDTIYSEHDRDMIAQLSRFGLYLIPARKERIAGVAKLKEYECYYIGDNYHHEVMTYSYIKVKDSVTGNVILTNDPMDGHDHLADASRYACYSDSLVNNC